MCFRRECALFFGFLQVALVPSVFAEQTPAQRAGEMLQSPHRHPELIVQFNAANVLRFRVEGMARLDNHGKIAQVELEAEVHGGYITPNGVKQQTLFEMETTLATELGDNVILTASPSSSAGGSAIALVVSVSRN